MTDDLAAHSDTQNHPVTISVSRKVVPGREAEFEDWIRGVAEAASHFEGQQGLSILRPSDQTGGRYVMIYRFDSYEHAAAWETSPERSQWIAKLEGISDGDADRKSETGLEVWFDLPEVPATVPPRYKMAVLLIVVIFALVFALQVFLVPFLVGWPRWAQTLSIVTIQVVSMTYVIMPIITVLLKPWLFRNQTQAIR
ncbi:antibiotic biosynthesis monooxygenase [Ruegeria lacuscaerulensis]|uniref:antibiotic biosynthesis monooxygenase n=1 Tax=Ruegeria lacuscaerulensis TaxID=55218 RepID=UPI00147D0C42|nr:antibiotic biosynthesis monooxygenase [Ruegeria lacuscaerulensis]